MAGVFVFCPVDEGFHDGAQLVAQEDGHDGGRRLVGSETVVVAGRRHRHAQELLVVVHRLDDGGEEHQEAQVLAGILARIQQVLTVGAHRPVVVLARAVNAFEGLFVQQAGQAVIGCEQAHLLHGQQVLVDRPIRVREDGRQFVLGGRDLVVLGARGDAERPQLFVQLFHEVVDRGANGSEVVFFEFLALAGRGAEQRAPGKHQIFAGGVVFF